ncbi:MAG: mechanosensitive ion channel domain-containing protein [Pseudomonadota bacterium]
MRGSTPLMAMVHRLILLFLLMLPVPAFAQGLGLLGAGSSAASDSSDIETILEQASEAGVGVIVIDTNGTVLSPVPRAAPESASPGEGTSLMKLQEDANNLREAFVTQFADIPEAARLVVSVLKANSPTGSLFIYLEVLLMSLLFFGIGILAERHIYGKRFAGRFIIPRIKKSPQGYLEKMPFLIFRFFGGVIGILFSMAVAYLIGFIAYGPIEDSSIQYTATLINVGYFSVRLIAATWRMILSPYLSQYRIPRLSDADARKLHLWLCTIVTMGIFAALFTSWVREFGLGPQVADFIGLQVSFVLMLLNILLVFANREAITSAILHGGEMGQSTWLLRFLANVWVPAVVVFLVFAWSEFAYDLIYQQPPGIPLLTGAYLVLTVILVVFGVINYAIERSFARARALRELNVADEDISEPDGSDSHTPDVVVAERSRITTFEGLARRVAGILAFVAGLGAFFSIWSPDTDMMSNMGNSLSDTAMDVIVILFIGYILYNVFRIWIDNKIREEQGDEEPAELGDEGGGTSASRLATLLPLFRNFVLIVIVVTVLLIILMELGVNVGPLFAGAGIVGVAVGFGSQSLVRDIFSGAFFLFDDAFRKGEYIEIGEVKGTVENISVRSFQLRHHLGKLHTIPFGEIQVLTNYSRDWVMMKLPLRVTYDTDVDRVRKLIKKLGQDLLNDPVIGGDFVQPLKSQGVIEMQDSAMIIRVKFMTKPGDQWVARKRVYEEIRALFEREGIKFAHREVTVRLADGASSENLTPQQKDAVLAAAEASIEEEDMAEAMGGDDR